MTDFVILNLGQVMRRTPELAPDSLNFNIRPTDVVRFVRKFKKFYRWRGHRGERKDGEKEEEGEEDEQVNNMAEGDRK
ncbi:hypothetical protein TNCV_5135191 [Trichonephila clavipes]|nr:hypothetical protein TNCV_5135191 [Trichonephila clavipes]